MDLPGCPGCRQRDARIAELERRLAALEARVNTNASNSSLPPSANPLGAAAPVVKKKSKRKRGGQPGHRPHRKQLLPPERVSHVEHFVPCRCPRCDAALPAEAGPRDPPPNRFQTVELPTVVAVVTEYQGHARTCVACGEVARAVVPRDLTRHGVGPRLASTLSYLAGSHGVGKRGIAEIAEVVFGVPLALGTVANLEREVGAALAPAHAEALAAVQQAEVKHADETSWKRAGQLCWLWAAATAGVAVFVIHAKRNALGLTAVLGMEIQGILCSDRWGVYARVPPARRQICWAHLKRDFQKVVDRGGPGAAWGRRAGRIVKSVFAAWHAYRDQRATREQMQAELDRIAQRMNRLLLEGWLNDDGDRTLATLCAHLLELEPSLWTFARVEGVEPTNNFMERLLRRAVLWRRRSFGCASVQGCRFVERILTVVQTRRLQSKNALDYIQTALQAHRAGKACPQLLPLG